ncbi:hypothetical protein CRE_21319 [Caenorhabditis remanei]|uniref:DUF281 domain-containing protein n=1 Tax=Caenorhabditis remanei TaxID=31234 RepID=E3MUP0_CAERE|nr:hypothetical protein CRE_21319 [Caenorhabditis remanei]
MNWFILLSIIFFSVFQDGNCCMKFKRSSDDCKCPDIFDHLATISSKDDVLYTEEGGCVYNITCRVHFETILAFKLADSEILFPEDNNSDWARLHAGEEEGSSVDIFSLFGMICENNGWYITKYPSGIEYFSKNCNCYPFIGVGGEYDGKKSKLDEFDW